MDILSKKARSERMSRIKGKETKPEIIVRKLLFALGFRYRKNVRSLPGTPDIVLKKYNTVIFINGCFWHGHTCRAARLPTTRPDFWKEKITANVTRDQLKIRSLKKLGWEVIVIWQCEIKNQALRTKKIDRIAKEIRKRK